ncbi:hypothetical protein AGMMS4952_01320 [Spirochaetia bacterium]|nr:hypothetical protein AGMMS4952_01320 [Spirochaetia bacterium]
MTGRMHPVSLRTETNQTYGLRPPGAGSMRTVMPRAPPGCVGMGSWRWRELNNQALAKDPPLQPYAPAWASGGP